MCTYKLAHTCCKSVVNERLPTSGDSLSSASADQRFSWVSKITTSRQLSSAGDTERTFNYSGIERLSEGSDEQESADSPSSSLGAIDSH